MSVYRDYITPGFIHWTCYHAIRPGEIKKLMPLIVRGSTPPETLQRDGIPCMRIDFDPVRRFAIYATPAAMEDIRTAVNLVREMHSDANQ